MEINRLGILLTEKKKTHRWLGEQLGVDSSTVSKWCTNSSQPSIAMLFKLMDVLKVGADEIVNFPKGIRPVYKD